MRLLAREEGPRARFRTRPLAGRAALYVLVPMLALSTLATARSLPSPIETGTPSFEGEVPTVFMAQRGAVSLDQAIQLASRRYPGRVVRAETTERGGRRVHEIRILVERDGDARMRIVRIDAENGRFL